MRYPKVLIISNNCFSTTGSNGRTLSNFFLNWPSEKLAQFYIHNEIPNSNVCNNYYRVTDQEALQAFLKHKKVGKKIKVKLSQDNSERGKSEVKTPKNPLTFLLRNMVWDSGFWKSKEFKTWIDEVSPEVIILQVGDSAFMMRLATRIAKLRGIPLIVYNSEDYYFKKKNYFRSDKFNYIYPIFRFQLRNQFKKMMRYASHCIYNTEMLQETYTKEFQHESSVFMTVSNLENRNILNKEETFIVSYLGNLSVGRHEPLVELAEAFKRIDDNISFDVYGKIPNEEVKNTFDQCKAINYKGLVSYNEVIEIIYKSNMVVHVENFNEFYKDDLKHAFSTKIADSLASGKAFVLYAPRDLACTKYLKSNEAACVITEDEQLEDSLKIFLYDKALQKKYIENALELVVKNHSLEINAQKIYQLIQRVVVGRGR